MSYTDAPAHIGPKQDKFISTMIADGIVHILLSYEQCFILFSSFPFLFAFADGGLGFEFCLFVAGRRHALRSEWPFIIIIISY